MEEKFECSTWFERDRRSLTLTRNGTEVFSLWDDELDEAIETGFLVPPRKPRPSDADWLQPAIDYAKSQGLL